MLEPHGGRLINRILSEERAETLADEVDDDRAITLSSGQVQDVINITTGRYSPIEGFLTRNDLLKVVQDMTLEDGTVWPLPIVLDVDSGKAGKLVPDERILLRGPDGQDLGVIDIEEVYTYNDDEICQSVFGTTEEEHPGVARFRALDDFFVGGSIEMFGSPRYNSRDLFPSETRVLFEEYGWNQVVGFQTRNAPHRAHEYIQKSALEFVDGILIQPKLGDKKTGDYQDDIILETYQTLIDTYYPDRSVALSVFPSRMQYAGPREAIFDAIVRKNQGCTHFIVGRDHAGVGDYYDGFDSHDIFDRIDDIGITPMFFNYSFYCTACDGMASSKICPHSDDERVYPSGSTIREQIRNGERPSEKMMRQEVANFIIDADDPFVE